MEFTAVEPLPDLSGITLSTVDDSRHLGDTTGSNQSHETDETTRASNDIHKNAFFPLLDTDLVKLDDEDNNVHDLLHQTSKRFQYTSSSKLDESMLQGTAHDILRSLHQVLLIQSNGGDVVPNHQRHYRSTLDYSRAVQVTILCRSLHLLVRCNDLALKQAMTAFGSAEYLGACLPRVLQIFASPDASSLDINIRITTLKSCLEILQQTGRYLPEPCIAHLVQILAQLLEPSLGLCCDIRICAASCITRCLDHVTETKQELIKLVEEHSTAIISILSTAALAVIGDLLDECLIGLCKMARNPQLGRKIARRRCALLAIRQYVLHSDMEIRIKAITLCEALLIGIAPAEDVSEICRDTENMLVTTLMRASMDEADLTVRMHIIEILRRLAPNGDTGDSSRSANILRILHYYSEFTDSGPEVVVKTSLYYLDAADKIALSKEVAVAIVEFLSSPYANVRLAAIRKLNDITFWDPEAAVYFIDNTNILSSMCYLISRGSQSEVAEMMAVCEQILFDTRVHRPICQHRQLLAALISVVTTAQVANRQAFSKAVAVILELMSDDEHLPYFKGHRKVLPWLVRFANRTTDDDHLKRKVVSAIVRLSTSFLVD